jgi:hypothetical protein
MMTNVEQLNLGITFFWLVLIVLDRIWSGKVATGIHKFCRL